MSLLNIGLTAVRAHRARLQTISHNMSNVDTPGYSRQRVQLSASTPVQMNNLLLGSGVDANSPGRVEVDGVNRTLRDLGQRKEFSNAAASVLTEAEGVAGPPGENAVARSIDELFDRIGELALDASSISRRQTVLDAAEQLGGTIRRAVRDIESVRTTADDRLTDSVNEVNLLTTKIARLNALLRSTDTDSRQAPDLMDERDRVLQELAEIVDIDVLQGTGGTVNVQLGDGHLLVSGDEINRLDVANDPATGHVRVIAPDRLAGPNIPVDQLGGRLGGLIDARDRVLGAQITALDDLAFDLGNAFNTALLAGTDLDGNTPGMPLFDVSATRAGAASTFALNPTIDDQPRRLALSLSGAVGDNTVALNMLDIEEQGLVGTNMVRPREALTGMLYTLGNETRNAMDAAQAGQIALDETVAVRESIVGVSLDEELIDLQAAQRAFQSAARIIRSADEIMEEVINLKR